MCMECSFSPHCGASASGPTQSYIIRRLPAPTQILRYKADKRTAFRPRGNEPKLSLPGRTGNAAHSRRPQPSSEVFAWPNILYVRFAE
jgi:hypothetical protein